MWPRMMAGPTAPGRGLRVYQPATAVDDGTCTAPCAVSPRVTSRVLTPIRGMVSETGAATGRAGGDGGAATMGAVGVGNAACVAAGGEAGAGGADGAATVATPAAA